MKKEPDQKRRGDSELFLEEMADASPHRHDRIEPFKRPLRPQPLPPKPDVTGDESGEDLMDLAIETGDELLFMRPGIQQRLFHDLQRGRLPPEDLLDLHGLRVVEARQALKEFLTYARRQRLRVVQIIHGKGKGSDGQQPILKQKVNQWLRQRPEVLGFCSAPRFDGGTGATYALLSRKAGGKKGQPGR